MEEEQQDDGDDLFLEDSEVVGGDQSLPNGNKSLHRLDVK